MEILPEGLSLVLNAIPQVRRVQLRGYNSAINSSTTETIWQPGGQYAKLTTAVAMEAVSSSANDAAAGTGARTIQVKGLNGSYEEFTETVTLNGTTPVALANTACLAVNEIKILTVGSGGTNAGTIDVRVVSGSAIKRRIGANIINVGQDSEFLYTIPADHVGIIKSISYGCYGTTGSLAIFLATTDINGVYRAGEMADGSSLVATGFSPGKGVMDVGSGILIPSKSLLELRAIISAGAGEVWARAELFLVRTTKPIWGTGA